MGTNICIFEGRLTADAEYSTFGGKGTPKLKFSLANDTGFGEYKKTSFFNCELIGKQADSLRQYMVKGKAVNLNGEMIQQKWEDVDGNKKSKFVFNVRGVSFTSGSKSEGEQGMNSNPTQGFKTPPNSQERAQQAPPKGVDPFAAALAKSQQSDPMPQFQKPDASGYKESMDDIPFGTF